jgi:hypothetical protein
LMHVGFYQGIKEIGLDNQSYTRGFARPHA